MPYPELSYALVQALRKNGVKNIKEPTRMEQTMNRLEQLMREYTESNTEKK